MTLYQFFSILRARRGVAAVILLTTLALALCWVMLRPTMYTARTAVLVDVRTTDPVTGSAMQGMIAPSFMATQIDIVRSERVAQRVVDQLQIDRSPEAMLEWKEATQGRGSPQAWFAAQLQSTLDVRPARETNIISIAWTGKDPAEAKRTTDAFAQAYLDTSLELKTEPARGYAVWFEEQLAASRQNLEKAQARLSQYQQRAGIVTGDESLDFETARLNDISAQLTLVQGQTTESQNKRGASRDTVAEVMASPLINGLKADIAKLESKIQESSANLGPGHPQMLRSQAELASLRSKLTAESAKINASIETAYQVGKGRERELQGSLAAQKARVLAINKQRDEYNLLRRELESAQRNFEAVSLSTSQAKLQSLTNQSNVLRLSPADEPLTPSGLSKRHTMLVAFVGGLMLAMAGALLLELAQRRVRSVADLSAATQLPVLAVVPGDPGTFALRLKGTSRLALPHGSPA
jgi:chain length determinant protein EpsF